MLIFNFKTFLYLFIFMRNNLYQNFQFYHHIFCVLGHLVKVNVLCLHFYHYYFLTNSSILTLSFSSILLEIFSMNIFNSIRNVSTTFYNILDVFMSTTLPELFSMKIFNFTTFVYIFLQKYDKKVPSKSSFFIRKCIYLTL